MLTLQHVPQIPLQCTRKTWLVRNGNGQQYLLAPGVSDDHNF